MNKQSLSDLARHVGGTLHGPADTLITSASTLEEAEPGQITFFSNRRYLSQLKITRASAVLVPEPLDCPAAQIVVPDPYYAFAQLVILLHGHRQHKKEGIDPRASIHPSATLGPDSHIHEFVTVSARARIGSGCVLYPGVFIGPDVEIGDACILYPNVAIYNDCRLGHRVIVQSNASIGQDGFGFATHQGVHHKIPHIGRVILEDDVEIGANGCVERGTMQDTIIGRGAKIGDLVAIGHGVRVGQGSLLVAQAGIAGSTTLGNYCVLAGQVGIAGHLKIGHQVTVAAQSGVNRNVENKERIFGSPAFDMKQSIPAYATIRYLPEMRRTLRELSKRLTELEKGRGTEGGGLRTEWRWLAGRLWFESNCRMLHSYSSSSSLDFDHFPE